MKASVANLSSNATTHKLLEYFISLSNSNADHHRMISAHWIGSSISKNVPYIPDWTEQSASLDEVIQIHQMTGCWPGMIGIDLCAGWSDDPYVTNNPEKAMYWNDIIKLAVEYWNNGGLVVANMHLFGIMPGGGLCGARAVEKCALTKKLLSPGTPESLTYYRLLDRIAECLQQFQELGITVIWRPFVEIGNQSQWGQGWWGNVSTTPPDMAVLLHRNMFTYFSSEKKLNNLLWVFDSDGKSNPKYPGDEFVDIVGADWYFQTTCESDTGGYGRVTALHQDHLTKKPWARVEWGADSDGLVYPDYTELMKNIKNENERAIWLMMWNMGWGPLGHPSIGPAKNQNNSFLEFFNDTWLIHRDDIARMSF